MPVVNWVTLRESLYDYRTRTSRPIPAFPRTHTPDKVIRSPLPVLESLKMKPSQASSSNFHKYLTSGAHTCSAGGSLSLANGLSPQRPPPLGDWVLLTDCVFTFKSPPGPFPLLNNVEFSQLGVALPPDPGECRARMWASRSLRKCRTWRRYLGMKPSASKFFCASTALSGAPGEETHR